jgi:intracellular multiplication protein IcmP
MAAAQQPNTSDNSSSVLWTVAGIFAVLSGIWLAFKTTIITFYFHLKLIEIKILSLFTHKLDIVRDIILHANPKTMVLQDVIIIGNAVGDYLRFPCIAFILMLAVIVYTNNTVRVLKRTYDMKELLKLEQVNWPQVSPIAKLNLIKEDLDKGPWAMAMTPMQFCKRYQLLEEYRRQPTEGMSRKEMNRIEVALKRGQANKVFAMQLGPLWAGVNKLPLHVQALFAVFAARLNNDSQVAADMLKQLSISAAAGKLNFTGIDQLLKKHANTKSVQKIIEPHAYVLTVMASMLVGAREDGVQASADFLWLKPMDRRMWYMLNTVGRQTPFVEVAGPFAHWVAEKEMGKKILTPMVEEATNALELALKDIIYKPDEEN